MAVGDRKASRRTSALRLQGSCDGVALGLAPALVAGLLATAHLHSVGRGSLVFVGTLIAGLALSASRYPLHLMPLAAFVVRTLAPVLGIGGAFLALAVCGVPVSPLAMVVPLLGAWTASALGVLVAQRLERWRPVRIAIIGSPDIALGLARELEEASIHSHQVIGWIADDRPTSAPAAGSRRLGSLAQVREVVTQHSVDLLVHYSRSRAANGEAHPSRLELFERVATDCLDLPVRLVEVGQLYEHLLGHVPIGQSNYAWFQYMLHPRYRGGSPASKRLFDLLVGSAMLFLLAPFLLAFAIAIKLTDGGPVFYRQRRVGEGGHEFELIKLRSMRVDSERQGARWSVDDDERVTPVGRIMRRLHIDELPQLWNILRGEMTLVGPRPERRELIVGLEQQLEFYDRRHLVKPGLAGWAQARCGYGGSEEGTSWKLCHDLYYLKHRSLYFDALILIENVRVSLSAEEVQFDVQVPENEFILG